MREWLDETVGDERVWPEVPEYNLHLLLQAYTNSLRKVFSAIDEEMRKVTAVLAKNNKQSDYVLSLPPVPEKPKHANIYPNVRPNSETMQAQARNRALRLSRPIGQQGCGFVWNRGRVGS